MQMGRRQVGGGSVMFCWETFGPGIYVDDNLTHTVPPTATLLETKFTSSWQWCSLMMVAGWIIQQELFRKSFKEHHNVLT